MAADASPAGPATPSPSLLSNLREALQRVPPFAQMDAADVDFFLTRSQQRYYAPGEALVAPADGPVTEIFFIRQGAVTGVRGLAELSGGAFQYEAGDLFPLSAAVAQRAVTATYSAVQDTFALALPVEAMKALAERSAPFADFLNRRILKFLDLSRRALQVAYASQSLAEQSLETPLGQLVRRVAYGVTPATHKYQEGARYAPLPMIMAAKKKPLTEAPFASLGVDGLKTAYTKFEAPPARKAGIKVKDVPELVQRLRAEAKVL